MDRNFPIKNILKTTGAHLKKLQKMGIETLEDFLGYFPRTLESGEIIQQFQDIQLGSKNTVLGKICDIRQEKTARGKKITKSAFILEDGSTLDVIWFQTPYVLKNLKDESSVYLVGKIDRNYGKIQITNPEVHVHKNVHVGSLRAIYPESPPLTSKWFREKIAGVLIYKTQFPNIIPSFIQEKEGFISKSEALECIHQPKKIEDWHKAKKTLGFEELLIIQCRVFQRKHLQDQEEKNKHLIIFDPEPIKEDFKRIPFELTNGQKKALLEILKDFEKPNRAHRLLQGDVGSGKTIIAFLAAFQIIKNGGQATIVAPTEILAKQHFANAIQFFPPEYPIEILTGSVTAKNKTRIKTGLRNGTIKIVIGTHALFTDDTEFKNLGIAVIDEQHRFGVKQRAVLAQTGAHVLSMTATPIPRTLALTLYGDQDISQITELPPGRKPIITRIISDAKTQTLCYRFIEDQIIKERQIFWICPLIDESDTIEAKNVKEEYERISQVLYPKRRVEFLHGKMKPKEKDSIMTRFKNKEFDILVSTSVIEVGVDIPNATVMVIENAERFGLSQLHQFRGRIGRNDSQCYCFLMVGKKEDKHKSRLKALEQTNNGLKLAEIDLKLRGMGEIYGTQQSGIPNFKCADLSDIETLQKSRDYAVALIQKDPLLTDYPALKYEVENEKIDL